MYQGVLVSLVLNSCKIYQLKSTYEYPVPCCVLAGFVLLQGEHLSAKLFLLNIKRLVRVA